MKYTFIAFLVAVVSLLCCCTAHKKIVFNIPPDYTKEQRASFLKEMDKGAYLYKENCSGCHGIFAKGRDGVPNFTHEQVDNYSASYLKGDKKNHAVALDMSSEQFFSVMGFLSSRKVDTSLRKIHQPPKPDIQFN